MMESLLRTSHMVERKGVQEIEYCHDYFVHRVYVLTERGVESYLLVAEKYTYLWQSAIRICDGEIHAFVTAKYTHL